VVFLTSHSDEATLARAKEATPYGFIVKPFSDRVLRTCIEIAIARRQMESKVIEKANRLAEINRDLVARGEDKKRESERLLAAARTDPLTEAANRLLLKEDLEAIADRVERYGHSYCAAFCDIDSFKSYNDRVGHLEGDRAIRAVSDEIRRRLRRGDGFYRYGGDEFLVLLPEQTLASAKECMERVRAAVAAIPLEADGGVLLRPVTMSVGVAAFRAEPKANAIQSWLGRADAALYRAKARGGNIVEIDVGEIAH
jgi:diguanylate cyclase (GGDEF)-like protein